MNNREQNPVAGLVELDQVIHQPARLAILCALNNVRGMGLPALRRATGLTQGNLGFHLRKLEAAGYVEVASARLLEKKLVAARITPAGACTLESHWRTLEELESEMADWEPEREHKDELKRLRDLGL